MAPLGYGNELAPVGASPVDVRNMMERGRAYATFTTIAPLAAGTPIAGTCALGYGEYPATRLSASFDAYGTNGASLGRCVVSATGTIRNVLLPSGLELSATAVVQLTGCVISGEITVASGGKVSVSGCSFIGNGRINNAGAAVNAISVGNIKTSAAAHVNVGTIIEV